MIHAAMAKPSAGCSILFAHFAKRVGFHRRLPHGLFQTSRPRLFHHIFPVPPSQTPNRKSRNNSPTVQHRKLCPSPETDPKSAAKHLRRFFDKRTTSTQIKH